MKRHRWKYVGEFADRCADCGLDRRLALLKGRYGLRRITQYRHGCVWATTERNHVPPCVPEGSPG